MSIIVAAVSTAADPSGRKRGGERQAGADAQPWRAPGNSGTGAAPGGLPYAARAGMILVMGGVVLMIALATLLPIIEINQLVR